MLEVVKEQQEFPPAEEGREVIGSPDCLGSLRGQELGIRETRERHPEDAVIDPADELRSDLERESRLARAARARDGEEARPTFEHRDELLKLRSQPMSESELTGLVASSVRSGGNFALTELEEALGADQVAQAVLAEVVDRSVGLEKAARRPGDDDLATVRRAAIRAARWTSNPT